MFAGKNVKEKFIACKTLVKRVVTFGVVLYRNQRSVNFIFHFAEVHIGISIRYKNTLYEIILIKVILSK